MTDREIIQGLINRDNTVTEQFFFVKCHPLFHSIIHFVFPYEVDYDEFVNELYLYMMENDGAKLKNFQYRCSVYLWLRILAIRYFIKKRDQMIDAGRHDTLYNESSLFAYIPNVSTKEDLDRLFTQMRNERYVYVIRKLILEDVEPEALAKEMRITTANLYNIKRRAMIALTQVALKDIENYGK